MLQIYEDKFGELMSSALQELRLTTDITQLVPGAKARALLEIVNRELGTIYQTFTTDMLQAFVKYSSGNNLDLIAELMGITRLQATRNEVSSANKIQKFYVEDGTFGTINMIGGVPTSFVIPAGTQIYTDAVSPDRPVIYTLIENVTCNAAANESYGAVKASEFGIMSNVGAGTLTNHNFELYADYLNNSLLTINIESIAYARDAESDVNLKYRIINKTLSDETSNSVAIRMAALTVPGVADVLLDEYSRGIGTGAIYIKAITPTVSDSLLATVQAYLDYVKACGNFIEARAPKLVGVEMIIGLNLIQRKPEVEEEDLLVRVRDRIYNYINSLDINESLDPALLIRQILNTDSNIKSIGIPTRQIDSLYIWKYSAAEDNRVRRQALDGYVAKNFERIVIEYTELPDNADPIRVRVNA